MQRDRAAHLYVHGVKEATRTGRYNEHGCWYQETCEG